jgi:hypothetical protein
MVGNGVINVWDLLGLKCNPKCSEKGDVGNIKNAKVTNTYVINDRYTDPKGQKNLMESTDAVDWINRGAAVTNLAGGIVKNATKTAIVTGTKLITKKTTGWGKPFPSTVIRAFERLAKKGYGMKLFFDIKYEECTCDKGLYSFKSKETQTQIFVENNFETRTHQAPFYSGLNTAGIKQAFREGLLKVRSCDF